MTRGGIRFGSAAGVAVRSAANSFILEQLNYRFIDVRNPLWIKTSGQHLRLQAQMSRIQPYDWQLPLYFFLYFAWSHDLTYLSQSPEVD